MTLGELIAKLTELKEKHGNVNVVTFNEDRDHWDTPCVAIEDFEPDTVEEFELPGETLLVISP
jgi:hypothetical protein